MWRVDPEVDALGGYTLVATGQSVGFAHYLFPYFHKTEYLLAWKV